MDEKDRKLIEKLMTDSSMPLKKMAKELEMPRSTVFDRINKLKASGVIKKFSIEVDEEKLGFEVAAFILIRHDPASNTHQQDVVKEITKIPQVKGAYIIAGEYDFLIHVKGKNVKELNRLVLDGIRKIKGVERTNTLTVFEEIKD